MKDEFETQTDELLEDQNSVFEGESDPDEGLSLDALISDAQEEAEQEAAPSAEEESENHERAERLAARFNNMLWWGLSKAYPLAEVEDEKIEAGAAALVPLAEKYGDSMPSWVDDFMEKPEIKAGLYVGSAIMAARASHLLEVTKQQEDTETEKGGALGN